MAIPTAPPKSGLLTFEQYAAEGQVEGRYDILDGERVKMPGATWEHQKAAFQFAKLLDSFQEQSGVGQVLMAPFDILIQKTPSLHTRQPDVFFISNARLAQAGGTPQKGYLEAAPELVIEIISDSETQSRIDAKIRDYTTIGVLECWKVWLETRTVEVLRLTSNGPTIAATYSETETIRSLAFPDLTISVSEIFPTT